MKRKKNVFILSRISDMPCAQHGEGGKAEFIFSSPCRPVWLSFPRRLYRERGKRWEMGGRALVLFSLDTAVATAAKYLHSFPSICISLFLIFIFLFMFLYRKTVLFFRKRSRSCEVFQFWYIVVTPTTITAATTATVIPIYKIMQCSV